MDIIGMTAVPEAQLAREAEICYAAMAHVTDYDCWHENEEPVTVDMLIGNLMANAAVTKQALANLAPTIPAARTCGCATALADAIITQRDLIPEQVKRELAPILGKYMAVGGPWGGRRPPEVPCSTRLRADRIRAAALPRRLWRHRAGPACPGAARAAAGRRCAAPRLDHGRRAGRRAPGAGGWPTSAATRCCCPWPPR